MEQLFIQENPIEKVATLFLERDSTVWVKSIITEFLSQYPQLQNQPIGVQWKKKEAEKGYAVGAIQILGGNVPVIVNANKVSPFDVIMFGNVSIPLTAETVQEMLSSTQAFRGATNVQPKSGLELFGDSKVQLSPTDRNGMMGENNGITRDAIKVGSFIDRIEHVDKDAVQSIFNEIKNNNLLPSFEENGTTEVLAKLANLKYTSKETELESFLRELDIDRQFVYEDEEGNKLVKQANSRVDYTWTVPLDGSEDLKNIINSPNFTKIAKKEDKITVKDLKKGEKGKFKDVTEKTANFEVLDVKLHKQLEKSVFLEGLDGKSGLYVDHQGNYCDIPVELAKKAHYTTDLVGTEPNIGDYGIFVVNNKTTKPFEVIGLQKTASEYEVKGQNIEGIVNYYPIRVVSNDIWPKDGEKTAHFIPSNSIFVKLAKNIDSTPELENLAINSANTNTIELTVLENLQPKSYILTDAEKSDFAHGFVSKNAEFISEDADTDVNSYYTNSETVRKNGTDEYITVNMNKIANLNDTLWTLIHQGASEQDITKIANLSVGQEYVITNTLNKPVALKDIEAQVTTQYEKIAELSAATKLLVKEAAVLKDNTTVDAVLSLNLMKKYNILEYIQLIPDYERVVGELAKLLIMVRLGLANLNEVAVKTAMEALTTTITLLKQLAKVNK